MNADDLFGALIVKVVASYIDKLAALFGADLRAMQMAA